MELFSQRGGEHVTGGFMEYAHDQMTSIPASQRRSGLSSMSLASADEGLQNRLLDAILKHSDNNNEDGFPGITEINHVFIGSYGPLKSENSKMCPETYSIERKESDCISMHESIWGTKIWARLQDINNRVDKDTLFDCNICIQSKAIDMVDGSLSEDEGDETSGMQKYIHNILCLAMVAVTSSLFV